MVSMLIFESSGLGFCPGQGHCGAVFGKTLFSYTVSLDPDL